MILADLGSNSLRIIEVDKNLKIKKLKEKMVSSALGLKEGYPLEKSAKKRVFDALDEFKKDFNFLKDSYGVATEAFRMASDSKEFFDEIYFKFGIKFKIISSDEEARLTRLGAIKRLEILKIPFDDALFIDLGGGSTEISYKNNFKSFKFGIVRFLNEFYDPKILLDFRSIKNRINNFLSFFDEGAKKCEILEFSFKFVNDAREWIKNFKFDKIILTSGVPTSLVAFKKGLKYKHYDPSLINGEELSFNELLKLLKDIINLKDLDDFFGKDRAKFIIYGLFILIALLYKNDKQIIVIDDGLLQGFKESMCSSFLKKC